MPPRNKPAGAASDDKPFEDSHTPDVPQEESKEADPKGRADISRESELTRENRILKERLAAMETEFKASGRSILSLDIPVPANSAGPGLEIRDTWSQAEQENLALADRLEIIATGREEREKELEEREKEDEREG